MHRSTPLLLLLLAAACGGGPEASSPDAGSSDVDASSIADGAPAPDAVVSAVCDGVEPPTEPPVPAPAPFACGVVEPDLDATGTSGALTVTAGGAGNGIVLDEQTCATIGYAAYDTGEVIVRLTGLTPGVRYVVTAEGEPGTWWANVGVLTGCDEGATTATCALARPFVQRFVAPPSGTVRVVVEPTGVSAAYVVRWSEVECLHDAECGAAEPQCGIADGCVECETSGDCADPARPVCSPDQACVAGPVCGTTDDPSPPAGYEGPDDGPVHGRPVTVPPIGAPAIAIDGISCEGDYDFVALTVPAAAPPFLITASPAETWLALASGDVTYVGPWVLVDLAPGTYALNIYRGATAAYHVEVSAAECAVDSDCAEDAPRCDQGTCGPAQAGPSCIGEDDDAEPADDARPGATVIDVPADGEGSAHARICRTDAGELDWFRVDVAAGDRLDVELEVDVGGDLDLRVFDAAGGPIAASETPLGCELAHASALPAGSYYLAVFAYDGDATAVGYTVRARRSRETCATDADCVDLTRIYGSDYRATCAAGACHAITATDQPAHAACDSADDCASRACTPSSETGPGECTARCVDDASCVDLGPTYACTGHFYTFCDVP